MGSFELPHGLKIRDFPTYMATTPRLVQIVTMTANTLSERIFDDADTGAIDPFSLFEEWFDEAGTAERNDPHAMALATVDATGMPDVRMVLMNARDHRGFVFFTNFESRKGEELKAHPAAAAVFHWKSLRRQVRIRGPVEVVEPGEADAYFATRSRVSQIGAHASKQSRPLASKAVLMEAVETLKSSLGEEDPVARPAHWSGFRIVPQEIEFWQDGAFRLHDRVRFTRASPDAVWERQRLYP
jgi:pyridoxamine 5'-phosphate oxidase